MPDPVVAHCQYSVAQGKRQVAYERYNYAGAALELAQIKERLAELQCQHEPLAALVERYKDRVGGGHREMCYAAAHYVVTGKILTED